MESYTEFIERIIADLSLNAFSLKADSDGVLRIADSAVVEQIAQIITGTSDEEMGELVKTMQSENARTWMRGLSLINLTLAHLITLGIVGEYVARVFSPRVVS